MVGALSSGAIGARRGRRSGGGVALVGGGPGDPGLITVRGRALLAEADVVVADRLAPRSLLAELPADVEIVDAAKIPRGRAMAQEYINSVLVSNASAGRFVVRLKGGDPFVFGRGAEEVLACLQAGIPVTVVPGSLQRDRRARRGRGAADPPGSRPGIPCHLGARPAG